VSFSLKASQHLHQTQIPSNRGKYHHTQRWGFSKNLSLTTSVPNFFLLPSSFFLLPSSFFLLFSLLGLSSGAIAQEVPSGSPLGQIAQTPSPQEFIRLNLLHVNPITGNDGQGNGTSERPYKSITQVLKVAQPNTVILLAPGTYSSSSGEQFPIVLKPDVIIQGNPQNRGQSIIIQGSGYFISPTAAGQNITILAGDRAGLSGLTVINRADRGYGVWVESGTPVIADNTFTGNTHDGISVVGYATPIIKGNYFTRNGANGITLFGNSKAEVRENIFENTGFGINVAQTAAPKLIGNRISFNKDGVVIQASARPILRDNYIERNQRDGIVAIASSLPNLGTIQDPGGNIIRNNGRYDVHNAANQTISASGNQLVKHRTLGPIAIDGTVASARPNLPNLPTLLINNNASSIGETPPKLQSSISTLPPPIPSPQTSIPIAVPAPESRPIFSSPIKSAPIPPSTGGNSPSVTSEGLLRVPNGNIPLGRGGYIPSSLARYSASGTRSALPLNYRVLVEVTTDREEEKLHQIVPEAFSIVWQNQRFVQAGVFNRSDKANELLQQLISNGFKARITNLK
jgi:parallel beta-helix repeat protein